MQLIGQRWQRSRDESKIGGRFKSWRAFLFLFLDKRFDLFFIARQLHFFGKGSHLSVANSSLSVCLSVSLSLCLSLLTTQTQTHSFTFYLTLAISVHFSVSLFSSLYPSNYLLSFFLSFLSLSLYICVNWVKCQTVLLSSGFLAEAVSFLNWTCELWMWEAAFFSSQHLIETLNLSPSLQTVPAPNCVFW